MPNAGDSSVKNRYKKLQSSFPQIGRSSANFNSKKVRGNANNVISKVVRNPLILDAIFAHLDLPDLKTARLVCHEWNDIASPLLGRQAALQATPLFSSNSSHVFPVNPKLKRTLVISDQFHPSIPPHMKTEIITKAVTQVSQLTREIKFVANRMEFVAPFLQGIRMLGSSPKIQKISIFSEPDYYDPNTITPVEAYQKLPPQDNLTTLEFNTLLDFRIHGWEELQPLLQIWIDAAPNLTTLDIAASLYPNLEGCRNLKVLKFRFLTRYVHVNLGKVVKMLGQVKDSLVELELSVAPENSGVMKKLQLDKKMVPVMSKLTTLSIQAINVYRILDFFDEDHFPKLRTLSIQPGIGKSSLITHLNLWEPHRGVQSLAVTIDSWEEEELEEEMIQIFPTVKEFNLTLKQISSSPISRSMESFKIWDLDRVNVIVDGVRPSSELIEGLEAAMSRLRGEKIIQFK
ncbi:uncharacterized protein LOC110855761 [Folsomia candida]|uniref:uncharacterized protein LOC110855761 n=1 Tax=Folsomia candida TaxID=158441 RepID=UPI001604D294|nr:uncharacterized protein LOC110855761 [Folsomia candida]